jgi:hypothetical protein
VLAVLLSSSLSRAQEVKPPGDGSDLINFVYASQLGTGIYQVDGRSVQVYRIPVSFRLRTIEDDGWGLRLKFPLTVGLYNFDPIDIVAGEFPEDLATLSLVPGVEFALPVKKRWHLTPFGEFGAAVDLNSERDYTLVYSIGLRSRAWFHSGKVTFTLGNEIRFAGSHRVGGDPNDGFTRFETGIDALHPLPFRMQQKQAVGSVYFTNFLYSGLEFRRPFDEPLRLDYENEVGVTLGSAEPLKWWLISLERWGIGYRFGRNLSAVRVFIGLPF